jgi:hypothetical protein
MARDQLWTSGALPVDGLGVQLRRFRKSHHLILAGPKVLEAFGGLQSATTRQARAGPRVRINIKQKSKVETACPSSKALSIPGTTRWR